MNIDWGLVQTVGVICFVVPFCLLVGYAFGKFIADIFT